MPGNTENGSSDATDLVNTGIDTPLSGSQESDRPMWSWITSSEKYLEQYHSVYSELLSYFESGGFDAEADRIYQMILPFIEKDPSAFYNAEQFKTAYETLKTFCSLRAESIRKQLDGTLSTKTSEQKDADKVDRKGFGKQKDDVLKPLLQRVLFGQKSTNLLQLSKQEIKALKSSDLLALFRELQQYDCELFYCGRQPVEYVAMLSQQAFPLAQAAKPQADTYRPLQQYTEPTVFFYNVPKSRQNYVVSYDVVGPQPTAKQRAVMTLWDEYFGGGMSSVLFQNVREFRSLAYSTNGISAKTSLATHANEPLGYVTVTGTQADKTLEAVATIDSLLRQMPMKEENLEAARQSVLNDIQNHYPTFRKVAQYVADERMDGYTADPNTELARLLPAVTTQDVVTFHQQYVAGNQHRVWMVIGDKKLTDMKALARFGKIVELKKADVYK